MRKREIERIARKFGGMDPHVKNEWYTTPFSLVFEVLDTLDECGYDVVKRKKKSSDG